MNRVLIGLFVLTATYAQAQVYKPFKVNASLGYAQPVGKGLADGFLVGIEPKYALSQHLDLGLRLETAVLVRGVTWGLDNRSNSGNVSTRNSALLTATYLFNGHGTYNLRPFVGAGLGAFSLPAAGTVRFEQDQTLMHLPVSAYWGLGGMIRAGVKVGHLVAGVEYNIVPSHVYTLPDSPLTFTSRGAYTGFRLGFDLGGGLKRK